MRTGLPSSFRASNRSGGRRPSRHDLIHSDWVNRNVLVADGNITAVFDWGSSMYGDHLYDVAWLVFCTPYTSGFDRLETRRLLRAHYVIGGVDPDDFDRRIECYELHIGLGALTYQVVLGDPILPDGLPPDSSKFPARRTRRADVEIDHRYTTKECDDQSAAKCRCWIRSTVDPARIHWRRLMRSGCGLVCGRWRGSIQRVVSTAGHPCARRLPAGPAVRVGCVAGRSGAFRRDPFPRRQTTQVRGRVHTTPPADHSQGTCSAGPARTWRRSGRRWRTGASGRRSGCHRCR